MINFYTNLIYLVNYIKKRKKIVPWIIIISPIVKKGYRFYLILNLLSFLKFFKILFYSKTIDTSKVLDCIILKLALAFISKKSFHEKLDLAVYMLINYIMIVFSPFSVKSIKFSIEIETAIRIYLYSGKNVFKELFEKEFLLSEVSQSKVIIFNREIIINPTI